MLVSLTETQHVSPAAAALSRQVTRPLGQTTHLGIGQTGDVCPPYRRPRRTLQLDEALLDRVLDERRLRVEIELAHDVVAVGLDGVRAEDQLRRNLRRRLPLC